MFEFDPDKSAANSAKHGIDFETAQALWQDNRALQFDLYTSDERRWAVTGRIGEKQWTAIITLRHGNIRIISVRRAWEKEIRAYEAPAD